MSAAFTLRIETPAAFPWRQEQMARLEAQHRSPVRSDAARLRLVRQSPWRIGKPGVFYAAIVREGEAADQEIDVRIDGEVVKFPPHPAKNRRLVDLAPAVALAVAVAVVGWAGARAMRVEGVSRPIATPAPRELAPLSAQMIEDLVRVQTAFSAHQVKRLAWTNSELTVTTAKAAPTPTSPSGWAIEPVGEAASETEGVWRIRKLAQRP